MAACAVSAAAALLMYSVFAADASGAFHAGRRPIPGHGSFLPNLTMPHILPLACIPSRNARLQFFWTVNPAGSQVIQPNNPTARNIANNPGHPHIGLFVQYGDNSDVLIIVVSPGWFADGSAIDMYIPGAVV